MKDKNWKDMIEKHGELRFFSSMAIKKAHKVRVHQHRNWMCCLELPCPKKR